jgi:signal transduction histidine kinase
VFQDDTKKREFDQLKDNFISVAAHQLRTPLGSMRWSMELLLDEDNVHLPSEVRSEIEQLYENNQRMVTLVNDLLNTTRIDAAITREQSELVDIMAILQKIASDSLHEANIRLVTVHFSKVKKELLQVFVAPKNIHEAFQNIISNAIKYSNAGGVVTISVQEEGKKYMRISITDTGIGIPKDQQSKIFSKFSRASNAVLKETDGSGLGLNVAKFFIEQSGGKIWFESEEGKGTTFFVDLPLKNNNI